jgi:RNA polymerase sigma-70 factor (ECF subfamily)
MIDETITIYPAQNVKLPATNSKELPEMTDSELVQAVLDGDETAFADIFGRYRRLVVHLVSRFFNCREEIEDLVQQSFTKIYFSLKDFRGEHEKSFSAWISRLTINVCYDELRRRQRRAESVFSDFTEEEQSYFEQISENNSSSSEEILIKRDLADKLLSHLEVKERLAMTLHYGENLSVSEVAEVVGWSESNVKTRLFRCRQSLRKIFGYLSK